MVNRLLLFLCLFIGVYISSTAQTNFSYSYDSNGNRYNRHVVVLKSAEGYDTTQTEESVNLDMAEMVLTVFPNPTMGEITLMSNENIERGIINIYDLSGRLILAQEFSGQSASVDMRSQNPGQYLMMIQTGTERKEITIIKE